MQKKSGFHYDKIKIECAFPERGYACKRKIWGIWGPDETVNWMAQDSTVNFSSFRFLTPHCNPWNSIVKLSLISSNWLFTNKERALSLRFKVRNKICSSFCSHQAVGKHGILSMGLAHVSLCPQQWQDKTEKGLWVRFCEEIWNYTGKVRLWCHGSIQNCQEYVLISGVRPSLQTWMTLIYKYKVNSHSATLNSKSKL